MQDLENSYMAQSTRKPNTLDGMFKPLPEYVRKDIATVLNAIVDNSGVLQAFNRLMAELHITTQSSREALQTSENYKNELNAIDEMLEDAGLEEDATVTSVKKFIERNAKVQNLMEQALDLVCGKNN